MTGRPHQGHLSVRVCAAALLTFVASPGMARATRPQAAGLSCRRTLALGLAAYEKYCERRHGELSRPEQDVVWSTYTGCRRRSNERLVAQLRLPNRRVMLELERSLKALETSYLACAYTETYSGSIGSYRTSWSIPIREDLYARVVPYLRRSRPGQTPLAPVLRGVLARAEHQARIWERSAREVEKGEPDAHLAARSADLRKDVPRLRSEMCKLSDVGTRLPLPAQEQVARHLSAYLARVDRW